MTRAEIIKLAREIWGETAILPFNDLERFAALVAAHEREACAKLAQATVCDTHTPTGVKIYGTRAAAAIRARSES